MSATSIHKSFKERVEHERPDAEYAGYIDESNKDFCERLSRQILDLDSKDIEESINKKTVVYKYKNRKFASIRPQVDIVLVRPLHLPFSAAEGLDGLEGIIKDISDKSYGHGRPAQPDEIRLDFTETEDASRSRLALPLIRESLKVVKEELGERESASLGGGKSMLANENDVEITKEHVERLVGLIRVQYPSWDGFHHTDFNEEEIEYKQATVDKAARLLGEDTLLELHEAEEYDQIIDRLEEVGRDNNLLWNQAPSSGDLNILYDTGLDKESFCEQLYNLLYGAGETATRLNRYLQYVEDEGLPNKWTFPTYFLYFCRPNQEIFVKPRASQRFLKLIEAPFKLGRPSGESYERFQYVAKEVRDAFEEYEPRDMIDIQSLIWVSDKANRREKRRVLSKEKESEFELLFGRFKKEYGLAKEGEKHFYRIQEAREKGQKNFEVVLEAKDSDEDITDLVLLKLLPYHDNSSTREVEAWRPPAPAVRGDIKSWYQNKGWVDPDDWLQITETIFEFIQQSIEHPDQIEETVSEFAESEYATGFQSGMLTPILNALRPDDFLLINSKSCKTYNYFLGADHSTKLQDYPDLNDSGWDLVEELVEKSDAFDEFEVRPADVFDAFAHWLVAEEEHDFKSTGNQEDAQYDEAPSASAHEESDPVIHPECPFSSRTFELLEGLHEHPNKEFYDAHKEDLEAHLRGPFKELMRDAADLLPERITDVMETENRVFSRILKNDFGRGGAWAHYWGAFYPKGGRRTSDAQLLGAISRKGIEVGFYIGESGTEQRQQFVNKAKGHHEALVRLLDDRLDDDSITFGSSEDFDEKQSLVHQDHVSWKNWLKWPGKVDVRATKQYSKQEVLSESRERLAKEVASTFEQLFPLVLLATSNNPLKSISDYLDQTLFETQENELYSLEKCASDTGFDVGRLERWIKAIDRKKQAIIYGPPGTGKTYLAHHIARHLIGGSDGHSDTLQFHPAYAYEDFIQGIRPKSLPDGGLEYPVVPGRFLQFCREARSRDGLCVLVVDEINRANLAEVFGELMYLLEYRDEKIFLASGEEFSIPGNVRIIGTMNTADRSIALVDHALRRRFAFIKLEPNYEVLRGFHSDSQFATEALVELIKDVNTQIADSHYELGISFFLVDDLEQHIGDIWRVEIEPYLEEYFFDQPGKVEQFRWNKVKGKLLDDG